MTYINDQKNILSWSLRLSENFKWTTNTIWNIAYYMHMCIYVYVTLHRE